MHDPTDAFGGVDWATDGHAVCVVDPHGRVFVEFDVTNTAAGARRVAIERPDGPVVDALLEAGLEVVVVSSRSVKALRERYGTAGNKSDRPALDLAHDIVRNTRLCDSEGDIDALFDEIDSSVA